MINYIDEKYVPEVKKVNCYFGERSIAPYLEEIISINPELICCYNTCRSFNNRINAINSNSLDHELIYQLLSMLADACICIDRETSQETAQYPDNYRLTDDVIEYSDTFCY